MKKLLRQYAELLRGRDKGTVALTFIFCLPILLLIISIMTQFALIINARIMLSHAVSAAARSAIVTLPTNPAVDQMDGEAYLGDVDYEVDLEDANNIKHLDGVDCVNRVARMQLSALSPRAKNPAGEDANAIAAAMTVVGLPIPSAFADRYTFAAAATVVSWQRLDNSGQPIQEAQWQPADFATAPGQRIQLTVQYDFLLTAPGANLLIGRPATIAGVTGNFLTLTSTYTVQLAHGREVPTDPSGYPMAFSP